MDPSSSGRRASNCTEPQLRGCLSISCHTRQFAVLSFCADHICSTLVRAASSSQLWPSTPHLVLGTVWKPLCWDLDPVAYSNFTKRLQMPLA